MRRGTTPTVTLRVTNEDGTPCDLEGHELHVTFKEGGQDGASFTKREDEVAVSRDGDASLLSVTLTQRETLSFHAGRKVRVQLRCKALGIAQATTIDEVASEEILLDGEI